MARVSLDREAGVLHIDENFDRLVAHDRQRPLMNQPLRRGAARRTNSRSATAEVVSYEFDISVDLARALRRRAACIRIRAIGPSQPEGERPVVVKTMLDRIRRSELFRRRQISVFNNRVIASKDIDLTAAVNNEHARVLSRGGPTDDIVIRKKEIVLQPVSELEETGDDLPILETSILDSDQPNLAKRSLRVSACDLINRGIDPSFVTKLTTKIDSTMAANGVTVDAAFCPSRDPGDLLRERYFLFITEGDTAGDQATSLFGSTASVPVLAVTTNAFADLTARLDIASSVMEDEFTVIFELLDERGVSIDSVSRAVDHAENVRIFNTPLVPPLVTVTSRKNRLGAGRLTVRQVDHRATGLLILKKILNQSMPLANASYAIVTEIDLTVNDGEKIVPVDIDSTNPILFRCIPKGIAGDLASVYTNVVLPPTGIKDYKYVGRFRHASVHARIEKIGIVVEIREIPCGVAAMTVERRDLTQHEKGYESIESDGGVLKVSELTMQPVEFIDSNVKQDHIYEYRCMLFDRFGSKMPATNTATIDYVPLVENLVETVLTDANVIDEGLGIDFQFTITTRVIDTQLKAVQRLIEAQGLGVFFEAPLTDERELLDQLLAHRIVRHNLTTGESEDFGVTTDASFSDARFRGVNSVKPMVRGNVYRYEVYALLRATETMFERLERSVKREGRDHTFRPAKYMHPLALRRGNITSPVSRRTNHARDEFTFGRVGSIARIESPLAVGDVGVSDHTVERLGADRVIIRWRAAADINAYDHFIIMKEIIGTRSFVGAAHNITTAGRYEFVHELQADDMGTIRFFIIPILSGYTAMEEVATEEILIG